MSHSRAIFHICSVLLLVGQEALVHGQAFFGSPLESSIAQTSLPTVTVRGFLNFRTTVDGTVIVFTPSPTVGQSTSSSSVSPIAPTRPPRELLDIKPTRANQGPGQAYPTGLVTVLGGTVVQGGSTTVYETKVIGTYISGKYAQILSSTIKVRPDEEVASPSIRPSSSYTLPSIVKPTKSYSLPPRNVPIVEAPREEESRINAIATPKKPHPLRSKSQKLMESAKARHLNARFQLNPLKSRWTKNENKDESENEEISETHEIQSVAKVRKPRVGNRRFTLPPRQSPKVKFNRFKSKLPPTMGEEMQQYYNSRDKAEAAAKAIDQETKEKILHNLTSTPAPEKEEESSGEERDTRPNIDPSKVVKEVQTITSEVTQHVEGNHLQVKTLTLTTTIERTLHPSESEFDTQLVKPTIDISVNDLEATSIPETPALVISRTYSVTERTMRTTVVPVFDGTATQSHTVTESFFIRKLITAYRTLPPGDMMTFVDGTSTLSATGELNTELVNGTEFTDLSIAEQGVQPSSVENAILATEMPSLPTEMETSVVNSAQQLMPSIDPSMGFGLPQMFPPSQFAQKFDLNNPLLLAAVLQNPQLAAVYLGLQQMKQQATQYNTITKPTQVLQTETIFNTKIVSFYDGRQTRSRTILEPAGTTEKVLNTFTTQVVPVYNNNLAMQQAQLQNVLQNQLGMGMGQQFQMTPSAQSTTSLKTVTTVTDLTMTKSKVYTLVYNAQSTRYRTITSTNIVPTTITTVLTETLALTPTASANLNFFG